jgi:flagellar brake protein
MAHNQPHSATGYPGVSEKISLPARIASLLRRVHEERASLTITVAESDNRYQSLVLEVNPAQGYVLLDELHPPEGHRRFLAAKKFHAHVHLKGVDISFDGILQKSIQDGGTPLYQIALPALMLYSQRRTSFRAPVGAGLTIPVILNDKNLLRLQGLLCDISIGGIGLRLRSDPSLAIDNGSIFSNCEIQIPGNEHIHSGLELCFVAPVDQRNMRRFGGRFVGLNPADRKLVEHFVVTLERDLLKKRPKD